MRERESLFLTECFNIGSPPVTPGCNAFMSPTLKNGGHEPALHAESQECLRKYRQCVEGSTAVASRLLHDWQWTLSRYPCRTNAETRGKNPHGFTNSDWPYKCYLAMSEPIADRAVRLMKDEDLWR